MRAQRFSASAAPAQPTAAQISALAHRRRAGAGRSALSGNLAKPAFPDDVKNPLIK
jgi:hypothetical protein